MRERFISSPARRVVTKLDEKRRSTAIPFVNLSIKFRPSRLISKLKLSEFGISRSVSTLQVTGVGVLADKSIHLARPFNINHIRRKQAPLAGKFSVSHPPIPGKHVFRIGNTPRYLQG